MCIACTCACPYSYQHPTQRQVAAVVLRAEPALQDDAMLERYAFKALHMDVHAPLGGFAGSSSSTGGAEAWALEGEGKVLTGNPATDADIRCALLVALTYHLR